MDYKSKYQKYKNKYLAYRSQLGGFQPLNGTDELLWVEGISNVDELVKRDTNAVEKYILNELKKLDYLPYVDIENQQLNVYDIRIFALAYVSHSKNKYYVQFNKKSGTRRLLVVFRRDQGDNLKNEVSGAINEAKNSQVIQKYITRKNLGQFDPIKDAIKL